MNKAASLIIILGLLVAVGIIFMKGANSSSPTGQAVQNGEIRDGVQYITINAKGGYWPRISASQAGIPTKLIVKTSGTYDCSAALVIRSLGFQKILAQTGEEVIDVGIPRAGESLQGICGMGMYNFKINFN